MKDIGYKYSSVRHENAAVIEGLRNLYNYYDKEKIYRLFDYLSELALPFPIEKDIVEILRVKIENNIGERWGFYSVFERIVDKSKENPKDFMLNLLGDEECENLTKKLAKRNISDVKYFKEFIESEIGRENIGGKGRHHEHYIYKNNNK